MAELNDLGESLRWAAGHVNFGVNTEAVDQKRKKGDRAAKATDRLIADEAAAE